MSTVAPIERQFIFKNGSKTTILKDPNSNLPVQSIQQLYANQYPKLLNATIIDKGLVDMKMTYEFETIAGTKG